MRAEVTTTERWRSCCACGKQSIKDEIWLSFEVLETDLRVHLCPSCQFLAGTAIEAATREMEEGPCQCFSCGVPTGHVLYCPECDARERI